MRHERTVASSSYRIPFAMATKSLVGLFGQVGRDGKLSQFISQVSVLLLDMEFMLSLGWSLVISSAIERSIEAY